MTQNSESYLPVFYQKLKYFGLQPLMELIKFNVVINSILIMLKSPKLYNTNYTVLTSCING